jgi:hypothetical protein
VGEHRGVRSCASRVVGLTAGNALREGYAEVASTGSDYPARKPVLQLLWCLEYAEHNASVEHQAVTDQVCTELRIDSIQLAYQARGVSSSTL